MSERKETDFEQNSQFIYKHSVSQERVQSLYGHSNVYQDPHNVGKSVHIDRPLTV